LRWHLRLQHGRWLLADRKRYITWYGGDTEAIDQQLRTIIP
jgi:hypothetical protein